MKKWLLLVLFLTAIALPGCTQYDTLDEGIKEELPDVVEVIHQENFNGYTVVMYLAQPNKKDLPHADFFGLATVVFSGNDQDGWEYEQAQGWTHYDNENMTVYHERFRKHTDKGELITEIPMIFGEINNQEIVKVEVAGDNQLFTQANIFETDYGRYYYKFGGDYHIARGLSAAGEVVDRQGG